MINDGAVAVVPAIPKLAAKSGFGITCCVSTYNNTTSPSAGLPPLTPGEVVGQNRELIRFDNRDSEMLNAPIIFIEVSIRWSRYRLANPDSTALSENVNHWLIQLCVEKSPFFIADLDLLT